MLCALDLLTLLNAMPPDALTATASCARVPGPDASCRDPSQTPVPIPNLYIYLLATNPTRCRPRRPVQVPKTLAVPATGHAATLVRAATPIRRPPAQTRPPSYAVRFQQFPALEHGLDLRLFGRPHASLLQDL